jgi:hypothetical protein
MTVFMTAPDTKGGECKSIWFKLPPRAEAEGQLLRCNKIHCTANFWEVNRFSGGRLLRGPVGGRRIVKPLTAMAPTPSGGGHLTHVYVRKKS